MVFQTKIREWFHLLLMLCMLAWVSSCSSEVDIFSDSDPIPIVYCFLNPDDSIQYLRLSKTFTMPTGNPGYVPTAEDLIFTEEPEIYLEEDGSGVEQTFYKCNPTDVIKKDSGWFPVDGMQLFATRCKIKTDTKYSLVIHFHSNHTIVFGQTTSLGSEFQVIDPGLVNYREVDLYTNRDYYIRFYPVVHAPVYQTTLTFVYDEIRDGFPERKTISIQFDPMIVENPDAPYIEQRVSGYRFLKELSQQILVDSLVSRRPVCFNFQISCGGIELAYRIKSEKNISAISQIVYTNIDNGEGLFSSLSRRYVNGVKLSPFTIDSIAGSSLTKKLGFLSFSEMSSDGKNNRSSNLH